MKKLIGITIVVLVLLFLVSGSFQLNGEIEQDRADRHLLKANSDFMSLRHQELVENHNNLKQNNDNIQRELATIKSDLQKEKDKSWWDKLWGDAENTPERSLANPPASNQ